MNRILLVDDDATSELSIAHALLRAGFLVHRERAGRRAIAATLELDFDAAIIDGRSAHGCGRVAQVLRLRDPELPIFVCTDYDEAAIAKWAAKDRMLVIEKPVDEGRLIWLLQAHVGSLG